MILKTHILFAAASAVALITLPFETAAEEHKPHTAPVAEAGVTAKAIDWPVVYSTGVAAVHMAPGNPVPSAPVIPTLVVDVDLSTQRMTISENGAAKYTWPISSARAGYRTPTGNFKPTWMSKMWYSRQYDMAPMPNSVFFSGGAAIHATQQVGMLGYPASHGCIRLSPRNAAAFYGLVSKHGKDLTRIAVHGTPRFNGPAMAANRRFAQPRYAYMPGGPFGAGYQAYGYGQQRGPYYPAQYASAYAYKPATAYGSKKPKFAQRSAAARNSSGFGYGFGGF